ncbi:MAG TPA: hypothetical protein VMW63_01835 [Methanoregulaceae archaeon]|nr:hypothetical protein [Methanoregulaceae archaeon]
MLVIPVSGVTITLEPDHITSGDQVTITISDLPDDSHFSLDIKATLQVLPAGEFSFETKNLTMPYTLEQGVLTATMQNTQQNILNAKFNDTEVKKIGNSVDGYYSTSESGTISTGIYDFIKLGGIASPDATEVIATLIISGVKKGPDNSVITFDTFGTSNGTVEVKTLVNGDEVLNQVLFLENPVTPATSPTTASPTPTYTYSGGGGGGGGYTSGFIATTTGTPLTETPVTPTPSETTVRAQETQIPIIPAENGELVAETTDNTPSPTSAAANTWVPAFAIMLGIVYVSVRKH